MTALERAVAAPPDNMWPHHVGRNERAMMERFVQDGKRDADKCIVNETYATAPEAGWGGSPEDRWPHHLRRKERATEGSVEKMATGIARSDVGWFSGRLAMT